METELILDVNEPKERVNDSSTHGPYFGFSCSLEDRELDEIWVEKKNGCRLDGRKGIGRLLCLLMRLKVRRFLWGIR